MISIIVAYDRNRLIGRGGSMPWHIPGELRRFRALTQGNVVIMGRKTYESIGKALPGRINIVLSRGSFAADDCYTAGSLAAALEMAEKNWPDREIFIGGGGEIYRQAMEITDVLYITEIDGEFAGDTYFPAFDENLYKKEVNSRVSGDVPYTYVRYVKDDMADVLKSEKELHPCAQPQDYIKLIFQSEFGPGHLIPSPDYARNRLQQEWQDVKDLPAEPGQYIGGGYVRLCIKGINENRLESINTAFVNSANTKTGSDAGFMEKVGLFLQLAESGFFSFDYITAKQAVDEYLAGGIRPTSHTKTYHRHYRPAYRVVSVMEMEK